MAEGIDILSLPMAAPLTGLEVSPIVQLGVTCRTSELAAGIASGPFLPLAGGTMTGPLVFFELDFPGGGGLFADGAIINYPGGSPLTIGGTALYYPLTSIALATPSTLQDPANNLISDGAFLYYPGGTATALATSIALTLNLAVQDFLGNTGGVGQLLQTDGATCTWGYPLYANGSPIANASSFLFYSTGDTLTDDTGGLYYGGVAGQLGFANGDLRVGLGLLDHTYWPGIAGEVPTSDGMTMSWGAPQYVDGSTITGGGPYLLWPTSGMIFLDQLGNSYYSSGQILSDNAGGLWCPAALYDNANVPGSVGMSPQATGSGWTWGQPQYTSGFPLVDGGDNLCYATASGQTFVESGGNIRYADGTYMAIFDGVLNAYFLQAPGGLSDSANSRGSAGQVLTAQGDGTALWV